jgi:hypothetical protein
MRRLHNPCYTELSSVGLVYQTYGRKLSNTRSDEDLVRDRNLESNFVIHRITNNEIRYCVARLHAAGVKYTPVCTMVYESSTLGSHSIPSRLM